MKILFIVKSFLTQDRQNALCIEQITNYMRQDFKRIDFLSWETEDKGLHRKNVYTIYEQEATTGIKGFERKIFKAISAPLNSRNLVIKINDMLEKIYRINNYDAIIAVINPAEAAEAVYRFKKTHPNVKTILYEIDPNSNRYKYCNNIQQKFWKHKTISWEKKIYSRFDYVIHMQSHKKHYSNLTFKQFVSKSHYYDIPNFVPTSSLIPKSKHEQIKCIYGGAFYPKLREPFYMFDLLKRVNLQHQIYLDIYTGNSMKNYLLNESKRNSFIHIHKEVPEDQLKKQILDADVLLSVGNKESDFLPSKTLMYMGTGKPIIHFYYDDDDVSLQYYSHYPQIFLIDQRKMITDKLIRETKEFLCNCRNVSNDEFEDLKKKLIKNTPQFTAKRLVELLND